MGKVFSAGKKSRSRRLMMGAGKGEGGGMGGHVLKELKEDPDNPKQIQCVESRG